MGGGVVRTKTTVRENEGRHRMRLHGRKGSLCVCVCAMGKEGKC